MDIKELERQVAEAKAHLEQAQKLLQDSQKQFKLGNRTGIVVDLGTSTTSVRFYDGDQHLQLCSDGVLSKAFTSSELDCYPVQGGSRVLLTRRATRKVYDFIVSIARESSNCIED